MKFEIEPIATEFTFDTKGMKKSQRTQFYKNLYGHKDKTHGYTYIKDGLLSNTKHLKPTNSTIILKVEDTKTLRDFLKKHQTNFYEKLVILNKAEAEELGLKYNNELEKFYKEIQGNKNFRIYLEI